jgi:hypothetical protein
MVVGGRCGHCKQLAVAWERLAGHTKTTSALRAHAVVAKIDAEAERGIRDQFNVQSYPTILVFPPAKFGHAQPKNYGGERDLDSLKRFVASLAKPPKKQRIMALDMLAHEFYAAENNTAAQEAVLNRTRNAVDNFGPTKQYVAKVYVKLMEKSFNKHDGNQSFVMDEMKRLAQLMRDGVNDETVHDIMLKLVILDAFRHEHKLPGVQMHDLQGVPASSGEHDGDDADDADAGSEEAEEPEEPEEEDEEDEEDEEGHSEL